MTRRVLSVTPSDSLESVAHLMLEHRVSGLPVVDAAGAVIGMITEGDLLKRTETGTAPAVSLWRALWLGPRRLAERYVRTHGRIVEEVMTTGVIAVSEHTPLAEIVALMEARNIRRVPVLKANRLVGIVSRADLLGALARLMPHPQGPAGSDAAIQAAIWGEIKRQRWAPQGFIQVTVENGTVTLRGLVTSQQQRDGLKVIAENTPGVKRINNDLVWVEPYTGMTVDDTACSAS